MSRLARPLAAVTLALSAAAARAADWTISTADFRTTVGDLRGLAADGVHVAGPAGESVVPLDQFVSAQRAPSGFPAAPPKFTLVLAGGDRLVGRPRSATGESLTWAEPLLGDVSVPFAKLVAMNAGPSATVPDDRPKQDVVTLANGDTVAGVFNGVADDRLAVQRPDGSTTNVPLAGVARVAFASTGGAPSTARGGFRLRLADGSALSVAGLTVTGAAAAIKLPDGSAAPPVPLSAIVAIEQLDGPVSWLSGRTPTESVQTPYLGGPPWPARFDAAVDGGPLTVAGQRFDHGIGVHAYARLTFAVEPGWATFRTRYGIDATRDAPRLLADVTARVLLDGKIVHERPHVRVGQLSPVIEVDLNGAKSVTLECDYGPAGDVDGHLDWLDAALVRARPATRP